MSYENPQLPQEVNVSRDNAVLEFCAWPRDSR
jgi:hypothetical protein